MKIVATGLLQSFCGDHPNGRKWVALWLAETREANWRNSQDIKNRYSSASFLAGNIVILNVHGNDYRMEIQVAYGVGVVIVKWIGTHAEYSKRRK